MHNIFYNVHNCMLYYFYVLYFFYVFLIYIPHMSEIMVLPFLRLNLLRIIFSRSIHIVANGSITSFLWLSSVHCIYYGPHLLYPVLCRRAFGCLRVLAPMRNAAANIGVHMSLQI